MAPDLLTPRGGEGDPLVLVHGLMGRGSTWSRQLPWLTRLGAVYTYDAPWHRGRDVADPYPISTERFVSDLGDAVAALGRPAVMVGHSMGALHSWCLAADPARPCQCAGGRGHGAGLPRPHHRARGSRGCTRFRSNSIRPKRFTTSSGQWPGEYFLEAFDRTATGWRLHGHTSDWIEIAAEWGTRDYWKQWKAVRVPALLLEAGNSVTPPGQMRRMQETGYRTTYLHVPGAGHLIHDDAPQIYQEAVESFLATLARRA